MLFHVKALLPKCAAKDIHNLLSFFLQNYVNNYDLGV